MEKPCSLTFVCIIETVMLLSTIEGTVTTTEFGLFTTQSQTFVAVIGYSTVTEYTTSWFAPPSTLEYTQTTAFTTTSEKLVVPTDATLTLSSFPIAPPASTTHGRREQAHRPRRLARAPFFNRTGSALNSTHGIGAEGTLSILDVPISTSSTMDTPATAIDGPAYLATPINATYTTAAQNQSTTQSHLLTVATWASVAASATTPSTMGTTDTSTHPAGPSGFLDLEIFAYTLTGLLVVIALVTG